MADLSDIFDIVADFADLFGSVNALKRQQMPARSLHRSDFDGPPRSSLAEGDAGGTPFRGSMPADGELPVADAPLSPSDTENVTESEYCQPCLDQATAPPPVIRLTHNNLKQAFVLSELLAAPVSKRKRRRQF